MRYSRSLLGIFVWTSFFWTSLFWTPFLGIFFFFFQIFLGGEEKEEEEEMEMIGIHKKTYENVTETGDWINRPMQLNAPSTVDVAAVVQQAEKAAQRCGCEGR